MSAKPASGSIRPAYTYLPRLNALLRERVATLTPEQLAIQPGPERWPLWATIGHLACQRVFWLCDFAGEPGAATSPFPNAGFNCPGDDDLDRVWSADELVDALDRTFVIVDRCLDTWTFDGLQEVIRRPEWGEDRAHSRGDIIQRFLAHDIEHIGELGDALRANGLEGIDIWS
jgi:uncharacterized damage-inducible protein DinB